MLPVPGMQVTVDPTIDVHGNIYIGAQQPDQAGGAFLPTASLPVSAAVASPAVPAAPATGAPEDESSAQPTAAVAPLQPARLQPSPLSPSAPVYLDQTAEPSSTPLNSTHATSNTALGPLQPLSSAGSAANGLGLNAAPGQPNPLQVASELLAFARIANMGQPPPLAPPSQPGAQQAAPQPTQPLGPVALGDGTQAALGNSTQASQRTMVLSYCTAICVF